MNILFMPFDINQVLGHSWVYKVILKLWWFWDYDMIYEVKTLVVELCILKIWLNYDILKNVKYVYEHKFGMFE